MKPKISTGYLTPQAKRKKNVAKGRLSDSEEKPPEPEIDENVFAALMNCPEKKKMILQFLASNKEAIEKYKKNEATNKVGSPLVKIKNKKRACESPTALLRRRALEQMNTSPSSTNKSSSSRSELSTSSFRDSAASSHHSASSIPFDKILNDVVAYVEIKNKDQDRSSGAKAILKSMGAKLREKFTNDVTHVIFKDGSFMTFQKAKLLKIHLVSILWVEFCRKSMKRQPEKQYPALKCGFEDNETSMICSQMQREYEDIIRDEYKRSIKEGTPLPSTRSLIDRRRTLMTPSVSILNSSPTSFETAREGMSSEEQSDQEVARINELDAVSEVVEREILIMNDPEGFSEASGPIVDGSTVGKRNEKRNSITSCILKSVENFESSSVKPTTKTKNSDNGVYNERTPKRPSQKNLFDRRKTICSSLLSPETSTTSLISSDKSKNASSLLSSDRSTNISDKSTNISAHTFFAVPKTVKKSKRSSSSLFGSDESFEFGKNRAQTRRLSRAEFDKTAPVMSDLHLSSDKCVSKTSSIMSSLQISSEKQENEVSKSLNSDQNNSQIYSVMSPLQISSERKDSEKSKLSTRRSSSMSRLRLSSEPDTNEKDSKKSNSVSEKLNKKKERAGVSVEEVTVITNDRRVDNSSMSSLLISSEGNIKTVDKSCMSTLQISTKTGSSGSKSMSNDKKSFSNSDPSVMSSLHLSSEMAPSNLVRQSKEGSSKASFSPIDDSGSENIKNIIQTVIENLKTPEPVIGRKKSDKAPASLSRSSINSNDSEIVSPKKNVKGTMNRQTADDYLADKSYGSDDTMSEDRELELRSTVTKRRKTLGSRRGIKTVSKTLPKNSSVREYKELVVNITKSPLIDILQTDKDKSESKEPPVCNKPKRRTLAKRLTYTNLHETSDKESTNQNEQVNTKITRKVSTRSKAKKVHPTNASNIPTSESETDQSSNNRTNSDNSSDSTKSKKKLRKLYNPDDSIHILIDDEQEREENRIRARKRKSEEGVFINPAEILKPCDTRSEKTSLNDSVDWDSSENDATLPKQTKKGNKKEVPRISLSSSADEQKELLEEVINKKKKPEVMPKTPKGIIKNTQVKTPKKVETPAETPSRRKSMRIIKPTQKVLDSLKGVMKSDVPVTPFNRRSTLDFQPKSSSKKPKKLDKMKLPTIVCTKLHKADVQVFAQIIKKLGRFIVEDEVSPKTTHLVAGEPKRTINMLRAISRGCWVLKFEWVLKSLEAGKWLREEDFEVHDFSPVVQKVRLERQAFGPTYTLDVFESCPPIYVASSTNPRCSDLKDLITTCRGKVVTAPRMAKIIVGEFLNKEEDTVCVNEAWVLDCITFNKRMGFKKQYLLENDEVSKDKRKSLVV